MYDNTQKGQTKLYAVAGLAFILLFGLMMTFITVDEGDRAVVTTWGEASGEMDPGMNFRVPVMQGVETYTVREQVAAFGDQDAARSSLEFGRIDAKTDGGADMRTDIAIGFRLQPEKVTDVYRDLGTESQYYQRLVNNEIDSVVRDVASDYTIEQLHRNQGRMAFQEDIKTELAEEFEVYGFEVTRVNLENINFDQSIEDAINAAEAKQYEVEERQRAIEVEEAEAERKRVEAEGVRQAEEEIAQVFQGDDAYLQYLFITEALANEEATHPIYVPMDDGGMDMFKDIDNFDVEALEQAAQ